MEEELQNLLHNLEYADEFIVTLTILKSGEEGAGAKVYTDCVIDNWPDAKLDDARGQISSLLYKMKLEHQDKTSDSDETSVW